MKMKTVFVSLTLFFIYQPVQSQQWLDVGGGADYQVRCFYHDTVSNLLYVGGGFDHCGANIIHQIGIWNGNTWTAVGSNDQFTNNSFSGSVETITMLNGDLIVGGLFDSVAGIPAKNMARWDGSQWHPMGNGLDEVLYSLQVYNGELYAGGQFQHSGSDTLYNIAKWDGTNWIKLGQSWGLNNIVTTMTVFEQKLIIGGLFSGPYLSSVFGSRVIEWDGVNWIALDTGFNNMVIVVKNIHDTLYAGGSFTSIPSNHSYYISRWDGDSWQPMPYPIGGSQPWVTDIVSYNNCFYVCGYFNSPPDIGRFNGSGFDSVGYAVGFIKRMVVYKDELYVAGGFSSINGSPLYNIARYNIIDKIEDSEAQENSFLIYPNPITKNEKLNFNFNDLYSIHYISLFDIKGCNVNNFTLNSYESTIEFSNEQKSGTYIITVTDAKKNKRSMKLILN